MKKCTRTLALMLVAASLLSLCAFAAPGDGLKSFDDIADMTTYTFTDVDSLNWCYSGIKVAYDKGILLGFADGTFKPDNTVNWSQAVAIAARIHSTYYGNLLYTTAAPGEAWYQPYLNYCQSYDLIPATMPQGRSLSNCIISRYDLAYIFSRCIDVEDMPATCDTAITDLGSIPAEYIDSVKTMYAAGVMTGYADYSFGGDIATSRAHVAAVVSRLLVPSLRLGSDARVHAEMADFESNLENDSICVQIGDKYYCLAKYYESTLVERNAFYITDGNDHYTELYTCADNEYLNNLNLYNGKVYFCRFTTGTANGALMCYDPATGSLGAVYSGSIVESYCFYDGELYALLMTAYAEKPADYKFRFGKISGGAFTPLLDEMDYATAKSVQPYGWNGAIYFKLSSADGPTNLYRYVIADGRLEKVSDLNICTSFFDGHVMYFMKFDADGNYDMNLYAISIQCPAVVQTIGEFPAPCNKRYLSIYKYDDTFYCLSSFNRNLYSMSKTGDARMALVCGGVYNALCFTDDRMILIPNAQTLDNANELKVYNAQSLSSRALYSDWIGLSCYYKGARFVPDHETDPVFVSEENVGTVSNLNITVPAAFFRGDDFIVRAKYVNNLPYGIQLRQYVVKLYYKGELVAYDINRMVSMEMKQYDIQTFTFVIGQASLLQDFDITSPDFSIEIVPTFDQMPEKTNNNTDSGGTSGK